MGTSTITPPSQPHVDDTVISFESIRPDHEPVVGGRAMRLAVASQSGLPVPPGIIVTAAGLGPHSGGRFDHANSTARRLEDHFADLSRTGRTPLTVRLSSLSTTDRFAERVPPAIGIITRSELLHAVRRFSVTATILDDHIAAIVQRDITPVASGSLIIDGDTISSPTQDQCPGLHRRLSDLATDVAHVHPGSRAITWSLDTADRLWLIDIGPEAATTR